MSLYNILFRLTMLSEGIPEIKFFIYPKTLVNLKSFVLFLKKAMYDSRPDPSDISSVS